VSTSDDDEFLAWIAEVEAIRITDEEVEARLRQCLESNGYAMPGDDTGPDDAGPARMSSTAPAPDPFRASAGDVEPPRTFCHRTVPTCRRRQRHAGPTGD
jgi:hypothetical protein